MIIMLLSKKAFHVQYEHIYRTRHTVDKHTSYNLRDTKIYNTISFDVKINRLLPIESEERGVLGVGSIPFAILPSCQDMKTSAK